MGYQSQHDAECPYIKHMAAMWWAECADATGMTVNLADMCLHNTSYWAHLARLFPSEEQQEGLLFIGGGWSGKKMTHPSAFCPLEFNSEMWEVLPMNPI